MIASTVVPSVGNSATPMLTVTGVSSLPGASRRDATAARMRSAVSNVIYLNNCKPNGCTVSPGFESSMNNRSSIIDQTANLSPFAYSDSVWQQVGWAQQRTRRQREMPQ